MSRASSSTSSNNFLNGANTNSFPISYIPNTKSNKCPVNYLVKNKSLGLVTGRKLHIITISRVGFLFFFIIFDFKTKKNYLK